MPEKEETNNLRVIRFWIIYQVYKTYNFLICFSLVKIETFVHGHTHSHTHTICIHPSHQKRIIYLKKKKKVLFTFYNLINTKLFLVIGRENTQFMKWWNYYWSLLSVQIVKRSFIYQNDALCTERWKRGRELKEIVPIAVRQLLFDRELKKHFCVYFVWNHLMKKKCRNMTVMLMQNARDCSLRKCTSMGSHWHLK